VDLVQPFLVVFLFLFLMILFYYFVRISVLCRL
jgi:preprotein translocase subunit SecE